jgi:hypothetical protein
MPLAALLRGQPRHFDDRQPAREVFATKARPYGAQKSPWVFMDGVVMGCCARDAVKLLLILVCDAIS